MDLAIFLEVIIPLFGVKLSNNHNHNRNCNLVQKMRGIDLYFL